MKQDGCTKVFMPNDKEVYGAGLAKNIELAAKAAGPEHRGERGDRQERSELPLAGLQGQGRGADCFVYSGITANNAVQLYKDFSAALPDAKLYGPDGVAESGFSDPKNGGIPADVASKVKVTVATLSPDQYPPEGQDFFKQYTQKYGEKNPDPYAIYGYEAMRLALDAIQRSGTGSKEDIVKALFDTKDRSARARHVLDRRERRHDADRLRRLLHRGWGAEVRLDDQGPAPADLRVTYPPGAGS